MADLLAQISALPVEEQLRLVNQVWDNIYSLRTSDQVSADVMEEALRRADLYSPDEGMTLEEMWQKVDEAV